VGSFVIYIGLIPDFLFMMLCVFIVGKIELVVTNS